MAVLHDPELLQSLTETTTVGRFLKLRIQPLKIREATDVETAFAAMKKERAEALITLPPAGIAVHQNRILELCAKNRLPAMHSSSAWVEAGGLMSYGPDFSDNDRRVAILVDKILKGTKPTDIPVEQPMRFEFVINLIAAKQIGVTIEPNVLVRATKVIR